MSPDDLRNAIQAASEARLDKTKVVVFRGNRRLELEITVGRLGIGLRPN